VFDLATAQIRLGTTTGAQDLMIPVVLDTAVAIAEKYLDRGISYATETVKFYNVEGWQLNMPRYPIETVTTVVGLDNLSYKTHLHGGYFDFNTQVWIDEADITYTGGYQTYPGDLELALWLIFDEIWNSTPGAGIAVGAGTSPQEIESVSIPDVGTIKYAKNASSAGSAGNVLTNGFISSAALALLEPYRRMST
jgi:hypothetical protein